MIRTKTYQVHTDKNGKDFYRRFIRCDPHDCTCSETYDVPGWEQEIRHTCKVNARRFFCLHTVYLKRVKRVLKGEGLSSVEYHEYADDYSICSVCKKRVDY